MSSSGSMSGSMSDSTTEKKSKLIKTICVIATIIAALGAINWGTISFGTNIAASVITNSKARKVFYGIVGIAGVITLVCAIKWAMKKEYFSYGIADSPLYREYNPLAGGGGGQYSTITEMYSAMA
jgi:uncharacterized membrane protein YuzA (DUF378 family)